MNEVLFLRLLRYDLVAFQAMQLLSYAYVPSSYAIISKGTFQARVELRLRSICSYVYVRRYPATLTFQDAYTFQKIRLRSDTASQLCLHYKILLCFFKLRYNNKRYAFNPELSYAYVPYAATFMIQDTQLHVRLRSKICLRSKRYGYVPSYTATQLRLHSKFCLRSFKLRYNNKRYAFNPKSSYAYVPNAATFTFKNTQLRLRCKKCLR